MIYFNFRSKHWVEAGFRVYWFKVNQFTIPILFASFVPNFDELADMKNANDKTTIELSDLSLIFFFLISFLANALIVFILEFSTFNFKIYGKAIWAQNWA